MQTIKEKLHSNSGASMIMALLLMLVGVVTSAVIIAASLSAALHIKEDRAQQQAYLTVSSAAELIRDQLEAGKSDYEKKVKTVKTETITESWSYLSGWTTTTTWGEPEETTTYTYGNGIFSKIMESAMTYLKDYTTATYHKTYTISVDSNDYADVSAEVFIEKQNDGNEDKYSLTIWLTGGEKPYQCRMVLTMNGNTTTGTSGGDTPMTTYPDWYTTIKTYTTFTTTTVTWKDPKLQRKETTN